jgi:hypothetical protein
MCLAGKSWKHIAARDALYRSASPVRSPRRLSLCTMSCFDRHDARLPHWLPRVFQKPPLHTTIVKFNLP